MEEKNELYKSAMNALAVDYEWVEPIEGYYGYFVSNMGNVFRYVQGRLKQLKPFKDKDGYLLVDLCVNKKRITSKVHRLVCKTFHPEFKEELQVDHINHIRDDNKLSNLRLVTNQQNAMNQKIHRNNKSGFKGVSYDKSSKKYRARIMLSGRSIYIGCYQTAEEAAAAYNEKANELFGKYAFVNIIIEQ